jgi:hypothetical protein
LIFRTQQKIFQSDRQSKRQKEQTNKCKSIQAGRYDFDLEEEDDPVPIDPVVRRRLVSSGSEDGEDSPINRATEVKPQTTANASKKGRPFCQ